ncbi:MAG: gamma-glutamyltransferase [Mariprofundales bacterium]|nr:gamma-glutamyltransferase [Mariprofundales bacterium]
MTLRAMGRIIRIWTAFLLFTVGCSAWGADDFPSQGAVVAAQPAAAQAGVAMLEAGGNAFDAAAATALALGVVEPGSSGLGGGGFFLLYIAKQHRFVMIDGRESSPQLAGHGEIYQRKSSIDGPQSAGVPGLLAAVARMQQHYGKLPRADTVAPAIHLATKGFTVTPRLRRMLDWRKDVLNPAAKRLFLSGNRIRQPALAQVLRRYAKFGKDDFYRGQTAGRMVADMQRDGGLIRLEDLAGYRAKERRPVVFHWHGYRVVSAALPSSGGMVLKEIFGMMQHDDLMAMDRADRTHLLIEAMQRAYRDRNRFLGDSDQVTIPSHLLNPIRLAKLRQSIDMAHTTPSAELGKSTEPAGNGRDTTHFSVIDRHGNMVAATLSINYGFGSGYVSPSTGILFNDEMDDFATRPGVPNAYGLVQGKANAVAPGKRMLSSMTPTIIQGKRRTLILGTPGGSRIISMVLLTAVAFMRNQTPPESWVAAGRFHHQFLPDVVQFEPGALDAAMQKELRARGHRLQQVHSYGNMQAILWDRPSGVLTLLSDPRGEGEGVRQQ